MAKKLNDLIDLRVYNPGPAEYDLQNMQNIHMKINQSFTIGKENKFLPEKPNQFIPGPGTY